MFEHPNSPHMCSSRGPGRYAVSVPRQTGSQGTAKRAADPRPRAQQSQQSLWLLHHPQQVPTVYALDNLATTLGDAASRDHGTKAATRLA